MARLIYTALEISLYTEAKKNVINNWREIVKYMLKHEPEIPGLPDDLKHKYSQALESKDAKVIASIQNRLKTLSKKTRNDAGIKGQEMVNVSRDGGQTAEEIMNQMRNSEKKEKEMEKALLSSELEVVEQLNLSSDSVISSKSERQVIQSEVLEDNIIDGTGDKGKRKRKIEVVDDSSKSKCGKAEKRERLSPDPLQKTMDKAEKMIKQGQKTAKLHSAYLKAMAQKQGLNLEQFMFSDSE